MIVVERAIVDLAVLVERLRQDLLDSDSTHVVASTHETMD